jgi:serine/threonine protein kinase
VGIADCLSEEQIAAYAAGDPDPGDAQHVENHLRECPRCRDRIGAHTFDPSFLANVRAVAREESQCSGSHSAPDSVGNESAQSRTSFPDIPGYRIRREIGRGGMGLVFEAIQTKLNRPVALKVLPRMLASISTDAVKRFRAEASAAARLHHNNIIPIYDFGESDGAYHYAMELIEGEPLHKVIQRLAAGGRLAAFPTPIAEFVPTVSTDHLDRTAEPEDQGSGTNPDDTSSVTPPSAAGTGAYYRQVARWMRDVADGLHHAHSKGIIHRDIKPANLILASDGRMMVADFGLAKCTDTESVTMTGSLVGTWRYMSPEQALAKRMPVDHRTDIYSLAVTMYELLTFQPAFPGSDEKEIISKVITEEPVRPRKIIRSIPAELETICLKAMEKSRDARYANAAVFADEFRRFLNDLPIVAKPPGPIVRARKFAKRHRSAMSTLFALTLVITSIGIWMSAEYRTKRQRIDTAIAQGNSFYRLADWQAADASFNEARNLDPTNVEALGNLARVKKELYNSSTNPNPSLLVDANSLCDQALALDTRGTPHGTLLNVKGVVLKKLHRYDEAIDAYKRALAGDPTTSSPVINLGVLYALKHELDEAAQWFRRGEKMLADSAMATEDECMFLHANIGAILLFRSDREANTHLNAAHDCSWGEIPTLVLLARSRLQLGGCTGRFDARYYAEVADYIARGENPRARRVLALAYLRDTAFEQAIDEAKKALALEDLEVVDRLILAVAYASLGDSSTAESQFALARAIWPDTLDEPGEYVVDAPKGILWFESADELLALRAELEARLDLTDR